MIWHIEKLSKNIQRVRGVSDVSDFKDWQGRFMVVLGVNRPMAEGAIRTVNKIHP